MNETNKGEVKSFILTQVEIVKLLPRFRISAFGTLI
jgi:hypothetical protein